MKRSKLIRALTYAGAFIIGTWFPYIGFWEIPIFFAFTIPMTFTYLEARRVERATEAVYTILDVNAVNRKDEIDAD